MPGSNDGVTIVVTHPIETSIADVSTTIPVGTLGKILPPAAYDAAHIAAGKVCVTFYAPDLGYPLRGNDVDGVDNYLRLDVEESAIRRISMTPIDQFVRASMLRYPRMFPERLDVLAFAFLVLGNGVEWMGGRLAMDDLPTNAKITYLIEDVSAWPMRAFYEGLIGSTPLVTVEYVEEQKDKWLAETRKINQLLRERARYIDYYATLRSGSPLVQTHYNEARSVAGYIKKGYLVLGNIKCIELEESHREAAIEILEKVISSTPVGPNGYSDDDMTAVTELDELANWLRSSYSR